VNRETDQPSTINHQPSTVYRGRQRGSHAVYDLQPLDTPAADWPDFGCFTGRFAEEALKFFASLLVVWTALLKYARDYLPGLLATQAK